MGGCRCLASKMGGGWMGRQKTAKLAPSSVSLFVTPGCSCLTAPCKSRWCKALQFQNFTRQSTTEVLFSGTFPCKILKVKYLAPPRYAL